MRISKLPLLNSCPGLSMLDTLVSRPPGPSAVAGAAIGKAIELFHKGAGLHGCLAHLDQYCPASFKPSFKKIMTAYAEDERNLKDDVLRDSLELHCAVELPPAPEDPKQEAIRLIGHTDQIRRIDGRLYVWDVKSGQPPGRTMLYSYSWQLAAYALAAAEVYGEPVFVGGIIRVRDYTEKNKPGPVFWEAMWSPDQSRRMLDTLRQEIAWLHQGFIHLRPGSHCEYCPGEGPAACPSEIERRLSV